MYLMVDKKLSSKFFIFGHFVGVTTVWLPDSLLSLWLGQSGWRRFFPWQTCMPGSPRGWGDLYNNGIWKMEIQSWSEKSYRLTGFACCDVIFQCHEDGQEEKQQLHFVKIEIGLAITITHLSFQNNQVVAHRLIKPALIPFSHVGVHYHMSMEPWMYSAIS